MNERVFDLPTLEQRFWAKVEKTEDCWLWRGNKNPHGYGQIRQNKTAKMAHRVAYEWLVGPIPAGYVIDHLCENTSCVNPDHLEAVSPGVNSERHYGKQTTCKHGHPLDGIARETGRRWRRYCKTCNRAECKRRYRLRRQHHV